MDSNIEKLEILTERLKFKSPNSNGFFEISSEVSSVIGFTLFKNKSVAIARIFGEEGSYVPLHSHPGTEWFGIYSGKAKVTMANGEFVFLEKGNQVELLGEHDCLFMEDTWGWSITVPPEDYPES